MRIVTDSRPMEEPKDPESDHLFQLFALLAPADAREEMAGLYRPAAGLAMGRSRQPWPTRPNSTLPSRVARRLEWAAQPKRVREILADGASTARDKASTVLHAAQRACGLRVL